MHELSITESMIAIVLETAREQKAKRVIKIELVLGRLSGVVGESLQFCFEVIKRETMARDAELVIEEIPARGTCMDCNASMEAGPYDFICRECGGPLEVAGGNELYVRAVELE